MGPCCTAAAHAAPNASPPAGPTAARSCRSSSNPTGTATATPPPSSAMTVARSAADRRRRIPRLRCLGQSCRQGQAPRHPDLALRQTSLGRRRLARAVSTWAESKFLVERLSRCSGICENVAIDAVGGRHAKGLFAGFAHPRHPGRAGGVGARRGAAVGSRGIDGDGLGFAVSTDGQHRSQIAEGPQPIAIEGRRGLAVGADRGTGRSHSGRDPRTVGRTRRDHGHQLDLAVFSPARDQL